jgi:hypothetical protein
MTDPWQVRVYEQRQLVYTADLTGAAEIGRQNAIQEALYSHHPVADHQRVVIAHKDEKSVSRQHALIEPKGDGSFRITNLSTERLIGLPDGKELRSKASCSVAEDALLTLGQKTIRLQRLDSQPLPLQGLAEPTMPPGQSSFLGAPFAGLPRSGTTNIEMKALMPWLHAATDVLQSAASSAEFFDKAARAVVNLVNLDSGRVLLLRQGEWQAQAVYNAPRAVRQTVRSASRHVLNRVRQEKKTFWEVPSPLSPAASSLADVDAVVAAPILDRQGAAIGVHYGDRRRTVRPPQVLSRIWKPCSWRYSPVASPLDWPGSNKKKPL